MSRYVVKVYDFGVIDNFPFFVMEWIEPELGSSGIDMSYEMGRTSLSKAKRILFDICEALELAHSKGIVHSDIAPWNIVYDSKERVYKLSDFGLLKIVEERLVSKGSDKLT